MTPPTTKEHKLFLRMERIAGEMKKLRAIEDKRRAKAGPQQDKDRDYSARWLGKPLNWRKP
jgi:hypothetical protein